MAGPAVPNVESVFDFARKFEVFDVHHHVGSWRSFAGGSESLAATMDALDEARLRETVMASLRIDKAYLLPSVHHDGSPEATRLANDAVREQLASSRFIAGGGLSLPIPDVDACLAELDRALSAGLWGIMFHHRFAGKVIDHGSMWPILEQASRLDVPVLVHCLAESTLEALWRLERLAEEFPDVAFLALDALSSPSNAQWSVQIARRRPNIWFDTAVMCPVPSLIGPFTEAVGPDRLVYGSDLYVDPPTYYFPGSLFEILAAPVDDATKRAILAGNARRLLFGREAD